MQAAPTYTNAYRDYKAGKYDLAMQEFGDYLRYFGSTEFAPNVQYYIGDIYYRKADYDNALQAFDAVLEHYPDNSKDCRRALHEGAEPAEIRQARRRGSRVPRCVFEVPGFRSRAAGQGPVEAAGTFGRERRQEPRRNTVERILLLQQTWRA